MPFRTPNVSHWFWTIKNSAFTGKWQKVLSCQREMKDARLKFQFADPLLVPPVLKACAAISFRHGKAIHADILKLGLDSFTSIGNSVVDFYAKSGALSCAVDAFDSMSNRDSVSWNIIIHGHLDQGAFEQGLGLFFHARISGFEPNVSVLVLVLQACRELRSFDDGLVIHAYIVRSGFWTVSSVQNSLLCMYADTAMQLAQKLFDEMCDRDVISWSVIIGCHAQNDEPTIALELFRQMVSHYKIEADGQVMVTILKACTNLRNIKTGKLVHAFLISRGLNYDVFVGNSLVDMYSKFDDVESAFKAFYEMLQKNIVSWNSLLSGFVQNGKHSEAIFLLHLMEEAGFSADEITIVNLLQLCKYFIAPCQCKLIHSKVIRQGFESNEMVRSSLIDAYAKCNCISLSCRVFSQRKQRDAVTWSTMMAAFTHCGMPDEAVSVFQDMNQVKVKPNTITILNLIEACSLSAELKMSRWAHGIAIRHGLASEVSVGTAILCMYSKCGAIEASRKAFEQIPQKNIVSWSAMIAAYGMNGLPSDALALHAELRCHGLQPNRVTTLSVLSACGHGGLVEEGVSLFGNLVQEQSVELGSEHYSSVTDLLARAGLLDTAVGLIERMPCVLKPGAGAWSSILSACRNYRNSEVGAGALSHVLELEPSSSCGYLLASSMYAARGMWSDAAKMRWWVKERGLRVAAGYSIVRMNNKVRRFVAGDNHHQLSDDLCIFIKQLHSCMKIDSRDYDAILGTAKGGCNIFESH